MLKEVYSGIDLRLYSRKSGRLEFDWLVAPGADYKQIQLRAEGLDSIDLTSPDEVSIALRKTNVQMEIPESYQLSGAEKIPVSATFEIAESNLLAYAIEGAIDPALPLVIDPDLDWGTYFDGEGTDFDEYLFAIDIAPCSALMTVSTRCVYAAGRTNITIPIGSGLYIDPAATSFDTTCDGSCSNSNQDVIVYVLAEDGSTVYYATHLGGSDEDHGYAIDVSANRVFVAGSTASDAGEGFPITTGSGSTTAAFDAAKGGNLDGFVAVFDKTLTNLFYLTFIGSSASGDSDGGDHSEDLSTIRATSDTDYVIGGTMEGALNDGSAPDYISSDAADGTFTGSAGTDKEMYIASFTSLNVRDYGSYVGGEEDDVLNEVIIMADGRVAFAGQTFCGSDDEDCTDDGFPTLLNNYTTPDVDGTGSSNDSQGVVGVIDIAGNGAFDMLNRIGGDGTDGFSAVHELGDLLYVGGFTDATDVVLESPVDAGSTPFDTGQNGALDAFIGSLPPDGTAGVGGWHATYLGGTGDDIVNALSSFLEGIFIYGTTASSTGFPTVNIGGGTFFDSTHNGGLDIYFATLTGDLQSQVYGTFIGGDRNDYLGDTGDPIGSNHIFSDLTALWLGTTIHSGHPDDSPVTPAIISVGSFDPDKTNDDSSSADVHVVFKLGDVTTQITLVKAVSGGGAAVSADFMLTLTGTDGVHDSGVEYSHNTSVQVVTSVAYTVSDGAGPVGYVPSGVACTDDVDGVTVVPHPITGLSLGQQVTCTLTNTFVPTATRRPTHRRTHRR